MIQFDNFDKNTISTKIMKYNRTLHENVIQRSSRKPFLFKTMEYISAVQPLVIHQCVTVGRGLAVIYFNRW